jgi:hypothetical protein
MVALKAANVDFAKVEKELRIRWSSMYLHD